MKKLTLKQKEEVKKIQSLFPSVIRVDITSCKEGGFSAKVLEPDFLVGVVTEGENLLELTEMINYAIYLALNVPEKYYPFMNTYLAPTSLYKYFGSLPSLKFESKFSIPAHNC